jgi:hypothetical protein
MSMRRTSSFAEKRRHAILPGWVWRLLLALIISAFIVLAFFGTTAH